MNKKQWIILLSSIILSILNIPILKAQTKDDIKKNLSYNIYQKEIYQLIMYETGYLTSYSFRKDNNLFGMGCANKRHTISISCRKSNNIRFSVYETWQDSILDFFLWMIWNEERRPINNYNNFYDWLEDCNWNTINKNYYKTLKSIKF